MIIPKRDQKGFTLVELLIVLAILAVLAAVVIPNITGMFGRGAEQALDTDRRTIQTAVATFYFDIHDNSPWLTDEDDDGHYYPTEDGKLAHNTTTGVELDLTALIAAAGTDNTYFATASNGSGVIWGGLLVNNPNTGTGENAGGVSPLDGEKGPYLQEWPDSMNVDNGNPNTPSGTYTWVVVKEAKVYALYFDDSVTPNTWVEGSSGTYP